MPVRLATLAFLLAALSPLMAQETDVRPDPAQLLSDRIARDGQGVAIAAARVADGAPVFASSGPLAAAGPTPVDEQTFFEIGSVSKIFTNLLLAQLVEEGRVDLDLPAVHYLPEGTTLPRTADREITLFDLATHSAGLPSIPPELAFADPANPYQAYDADLLYGFLAAYPLPWAPGERYQYSNMGTALIGEALSHVAGQPYGELVAQRILAPLGMKDTTLVVSGDSSARFASGHDAAGTPVPHWDFAVFAPAGGWRSTTADMARFIAAASGQADSSLEPAFRRMLERTRPAGSPNMRIGLGWMLLARPDGGTTVWHNGLTAGFNAFVGYDRDGGRAAVVLANAITPTGIEDIGFHLIDPSAPLAAQPQQRTAISIDPALLANYVGTYVLGPEFSIEITAEAGQLYLQATGQDRFPAFPETETRFFLRVVDAQVSFETGPDGRATAMVLHQNGQDIPGARR